jgi:ABC-type sugar transport system substrate-binding protein
MKRIALALIAALVAVPASAPRPRSSDVEEILGLAGSVRREPYAGSVPEGLAPEAKQLRCEYCLPD